MTLECDEFAYRVKPSKSHMCKVKFRSLMPAPAVHRRQLKRERPQNSCPDPWWIPEQCQGATCYF